MLLKAPFLTLGVIGVLLNYGMCAEGIDLKRDGAFGFPQAQSHVLCDNDELRVSAWSNSEYLYVQAIVWADGDDTLAEQNGRKVGDFSQLSLDIDGDQLRTRTIDRTYTVAAFGNVFGLRYQIALSELGSTPIQADSTGRGSINYLDGTEGKRIRVDSFLIPLAEIGKKVGETIRLAHFARSPQPELILNSVGFESDATYSSRSLPQEKYHEVKLAEGTTFDPKLVPEGRETASPQPSEPASVVPELTIGSRAPALDIEHWVQNGKGKFEPVTEFAPGKVTIVEFWATWCGPCIAAMPHIAEIQNKYADQGLQVVSISDEKLDIVQKFLEKKAPAEKDKEPITYGELTSQYCLTTDPDRSNHTNYMKAARQNGIPCAFVVGKDGLVEWIGHPMSIDKALASVVAGDWDREAFAVEYKQGQEFEQKRTEVMNLVYKGKFEEALAMVTEARDNIGGDAIKPRAESLIRNVRGIEVEQHIYKNSDEASAKLEALLDGRPYSEVNDFVWAKIVQVKERGRKISDEVLATATRLTEKAADAAPEIDDRGVSQKAYLLDTFAHLLNLQGHLDKAIEVQQQAVKQVNEAGKKSLEDYLKTLQDLKNPPQLTGDLLSLQGKWRVIFADATFNVIDIENRTFTMAKHSPSGVSAASKFSFTIDEKQSPKQMTWLRPDSSGQNQDYNRCIYELHGDTWLLTGGMQERPSGFVSGEGKPHTTWILKREQVASGQPASDATTGVAPLTAAPLGFNPPVGVGPATIEKTNVLSLHELRRFDGHTDKATFVSISPDGRTLLSSSDDKTVRLWDVVSGKELKSFQGHQSMTLCAVFVPDGKRFLTSSGWPPASGDDSIRLWDLESGRELWKANGHKDSIWKMSISDDGMRALSASRDSTIGLWNVQTGELVKKLTGHTAWVRQAVFVPNQDLAVSASWDQTIRIWDLATGKEVRRIDGHKAQVQDVEVSPDGKLIASCSNPMSRSRLQVEQPEDATVRVWDLQSGKEVRRMIGPSSRVWTIAFSPNGRTVLSGGDDKVICLWDVQTGQLLAKLEGHTDTVRRATFSPDGRNVASASHDSTIRLWKLPEAELSARNANSVNVVAQVASSDAANVKQDFKPPAPNTTAIVAPQDFVYPPAVELKAMSFSRFLNIDGVQKDLELTPEQIAEVGKLVIRQSDKQIADVLSKEQMHRLDQIYWYWAGGLATRDPEVATSLNLSEDQRTRIEALGKELALQQIQSSTGVDSRNQLAEIKQTRDAKVAEMLTKEQNEALVKLRGKPFDLAIFDVVEQPSTMTRLLSMPEVQAELKLSDAIKEKVAAYTTEWRILFDAILEEFPSARGTSGRTIHVNTPEVAARMREYLSKRFALEQSTWNEVRPQLSPEQNSRLVSLAIQRYDTRALVLEPVAESVGLTAKQKQIADLARAKFDEARHLITISAPTQAPARREIPESVRKRTELTNEAGKLLDSLMTDPLRSRMESLKGAKFEFRQGSGPSGPSGFETPSGFSPPRELGPGVITQTGMNLAGPLATLVAMPSVRRELGLTEQSQATISKFIDDKNAEMTAAMRSGFTLPVRGSELTAGERKNWTELLSKFKAVRLTVEDKLRESLTAEQFARLIGLLWQREGFAALYMSPACVDSISLTSDQHTQIERIHSQFNAQPNLAILMARSVPSIDDVGKILTAEQKNLVEILMGKKFEFPAPTGSSSPAVVASNRAFEFINQGEFENAIASLDEAIKLNSTAYLLLTNRGMAKRRMDNLEGALEDYNKFIELNLKSALPSGYYGAYHSRAHLYMMIGEPAKALADFEAMSHMRGVTAFNLYNRAMALAEVGEPEKAQQAYSDVVKLAPEYKSVSSFIDKPLFTRKETNAARTVSGWSSSWSPDGKQLVRGRTYFRLSEALEIVTLDSGEVRLLCENGKDPAWSPTPSGPIAFVRGDGLQEEIWIVNSDGSGLKKLADGGFPSWSADGRLFYRSGKNRNELMLHAIHVDRPEVVLSSTPLFGLYPAVSGDGQLVATGGRDEQGNGKLVVKKIETNEIVTSVDRPSNDTVLPSFSPDFRYICYGTSFRDYYPGLWVLDIGSGKSFLVSGEQLTMPRWSPDGKRISVDDRSRSKILILDIDHTQLAALGQSK